MARTNGGIIGKRNVTSFGKCTTTVKTSSGNVCTQPGTRFVRTVVVAGGAGGGYNTGGGGAGGLREINNIPVCGGTAYPVTVGGGGAGGTNPSRTGANGSNSVAALTTSYTSAGGGGGGAFRLLLLPADLQPAGRSPQRARQRQRPGCLRFPLGGRSGGAAQGPLG